MEMIKEEMKRTIELNKMMYAENPKDYEAMQNLVMIAALARRIGHDAMAERAERLFKEVSQQFIKPIQ